MATEWAELDPTRPADYELLRRDSATLTRLAQGTFSFTNGSRNRCLSCYWRPLARAQMAMNHRQSPADFIQHATQEWEREFGRWRGVNGIEAYATYWLRECEVCGEVLP